MSILINHDDKSLTNQETGVVLYPSCFTTLTIYHSYLVNRGHADVAQEMLEDVFKGKQVISDLVNSFHE